MISFSTRWPRRTTENRIKRKKPSLILIDLILPTWWPDLRNRSINSDIRATSIMQNTMPYFCASCYTFICIMDLMIWSPYFGLHLLHRGIDNEKPISVYRNDGRPQMRIISWKFSFRLSALAWIADSLRMLVLSNILVTRYVEGISILMLAREMSFCGDKRNEFHYMGI